VASSHSRPGLGRHAASGKQSSSPAFLTLMPPNRLIPSEINRLTYRGYDRLL
jgi:hypothetical protein